MTPEITKGLTNEQLQNFDIDSINEMISSYNNTNELNNFNLDGSDDLTIEEINIYNKLEASSNIINDLYFLITKVKSTGQKEKSWIDIFFSDKNSISSKNIDDYTKEDRLKVLNFLNNDYKNYDEAISKAADEFAENFSSTDTLNEIDNKAEVNIFQQKLINKIIGNENGFSGEYLQGFNNTKGNFLIKTADFLDNIKDMDIKDINSHLLVNLFKLLTNQHKLNLLELKEILSEKQLKKLKEYWNTNKSDTIAKDYLINNGLGYIVEMMNKDLDYYSSYNEKELRIALEMISNPKERTEIIFLITQIQKDEKITILKSFKFNDKKLNLIINEYESNIKNTTNIFDKNSILRKLNTTLQKLIEGEIENKANIKKTNILKHYGIEIIKNNDNEYFNITIDSLINKLLQITDINKIILIISALDGMNLSDIDLAETKLIDKYMNKVSTIGVTNNNIGQVNHIIQNLTLFRTQQICPSFDAVINLKKTTIKSKVKQNIIKTNANKLYPNGKEIGDKLINFINSKLENTKVGNKYCTIKIIEIIKEFDKNNAQYRKNPDKQLSNEEIKNLVSSVIQEQKEQINNDIRSLLIKANILKELPTNDISKNLSSLTADFGIVDKQKKQSLDANLYLRNHSILEINNLPNLTKKEKAYLLEKKSELKSVDKIQKNIYSYTDEEFKNIIEGIKKGKDPFEIKKEIEKQREEQSINTLDTISNNQDYNIEEIPNINGENNTLIVNGKEISGITGNEYNSIIETNSNGEKIIKNPEALKNLVDFKEKMKVLNLDFVWKYRNELTTEAKKHPEYSNINNTDNDLLNPKELHKLLNFILTLIGEEGDTGSISGTYAKIIQINGGGMINNETNFNTNLGNIGQKFYKLGYIGKNSFDTKNISNIMNYKNILKQKITS